jgi:hypothetical protein
MSNWIDYDLDVLASNPAEINQIAARLNQPSFELATWVAQRFGQPVGEVAEGLKELLEFKSVRNLGYIDNAVNKARRFSISFKDKYSGVVKSHLSEVSEAFPTAIFLVTYYDMQASYAGKWVERAGDLVQQIHDGDQQAQAIDWVLLDIFAPFRAEYELGLEFGSLWQKWLADTATAVQDLRRELSSASVPEERVEAR